jgi:hypothetical protein
VCLDQQTLPEMFMQLLQIKEMLPHKLTCCSLEALLWGLLTSFPCCLAMVVSQAVLLESPEFSSPLVSC